MKSSDAKKHLSKLSKMEQSLVLEYYKQNPAAILLQSKSKTKGHSDLPIFSEHEKQKQTILL